MYRFGTYTTENSAYIQIRHIYDRKFGIYTDSAHTRQSRPDFGLGLSHCQYERLDNLFSCCLLLLLPHHRQLPLPHIRVRGLRRKFWQILAGPLWEGCCESRRCTRDTYPESYITKYGSIRRKIRAKYRVMGPICTEQFLMSTSKMNGQICDDYCMRVASGTVTPGHISELRIGSLGHISELRSGHISEIRRIIYRKTPGHVSEVRFTPPWERGGTSSQSLSTAASAIRPGSPACFRPFSGASTR